MIYQIYYKFATRIPVKTITNQSNKPIILLTMRKIYSILLALMLMPVISFAANQAITKTHNGSNYYNQKQETRLAIPYPAAGLPQEAMTADDAGVNHSIGIWFKTTGIYVSNNPKVGILCRLGTGDHLNTNGQFQLMQDQNGALTASFNADNIGGATGAFSVGNASLNEWHHVMLVFNSDTQQLTVYIDGEQTSQKTVGKFGYKWADGLIQMFGLSYSGLFDEVQFYGKALTAEEVKTAMVNAKKVDGLTSLYTFDEVIPGTTGQFESVAGSVAGQVATYQFGTWSAYWAEGLVKNPTITANETTANLAEGRAVSFDVNLTVPAEVEGGTLAVTVNGDPVEAGTHTIQNTDNVVVTATPAEGWNLVGVYAGETEIANGVAFNIDEDATISAVFTQETYALNVINTCELPYTLTTVAGDEVNLAAVAPGTTLHLVVTVPESHVLLGIKLGQMDVTSSRGYYEFEMPVGDADLTIAARAKAVYTVTIEQPEGGQVAVSANGTALSSGATIYEETELTLSATSNTGFTFVRYIVNGNTQTEATFTPTENVTVSAEFEEGIDYCVPTPWPGRANGTQTKYSGRGVNSVVVTDGTNSMTIAGYGTTGTRDVYKDATTQTLVTEAGKTISLTVSGGGEWMNTYIYVDFDLNGFQTSDKVYGNYTGNSNTYAGTYTFTVPADLASGKYRVRYKVDWDDQDPCIYGQTSDNGDVIIDFMLEIPKTVLETPRTVSVASANPELGTVAITSPATEESSVTTDEKTVTVKATAAEGYTFMNWTKDGEVVSTEATFNFNGEENAELVANFGAALNLTVGENGRATAMVNGTLASGNVFEIGSEVEITFTPNQGKTTLVRVNGQEVDIENNTLSFTLDENTTVEVQFLDFIAEVQMLVSGKGTVKCFYEVTQGDGYPVESTELVSGNKIPQGVTDLYFYFIPEEGAQIESVTLQNGDEVVTLSVEEEDLYLPGDGGAYENVLCYPLNGLNGDVTLTVVFSDDSQALESIGIDAANGPVEYYNLQGIRVAADNLTNGVYIIRQGEKAAKVLIKK